MGHLRCGSVTANGAPTRMQEKILCELGASSENLLAAFCNDSLVNQSRSRLVSVAALTSLAAISTQFGAAPDIANGAKARYSAFLFPHIT